MPFDKQCSLSPAIDGNTFLRLFPSSVPVGLGSQSAVLLEL